MQRVGLSAGRSQHSISLGEVSRARPPRGTGAPSRTRSHFDRILALLHERGAAGVLSSELYDNPRLYGRSPRNRISDARKRAGCRIETIPVSASVVRYVLIRDGDGIAPSCEIPISRPEPSRPVEQLAISDYMRRSIQEQAAAMPLFAGTEP
jgi:hypothetical protein